MWISSPVFGASTHWNVIGCFADGVLPTRVWVAWVNTVVFYAGLVICTLVIMLTFSNTDFKIESKVLISNPKGRVQHQYFEYFADLLCVQSLNGSPVKPGGHLHWALWFSTKHWALGLHGLSVTQGLTQLPKLQASFREHSSSDWQPTGSGMTVGNGKKKKEAVSSCWAL